ncbi:hypothetical protein MHBO_001827 [Bonamia ostreae]|uniref:rRNA-processing protein EBP2 n=1 Tax=Bonamia ostreae TaxID=126728 RepID=A0ABV2AKB1_9EUKA
MVESEFVVNNKSELAKVLNSIDTKIDWLDRLDISIKSENPKPVKVSDDLQNESKFRESAFKACEEALIKLKKHKVPIRRPSDFFAEMVKSDKHMLRIKKRALLETKAVQTIKSRQRRKENRKFSKKVKQKAIKSELSNRKDEMDIIENWGKSSSKSIRDLDRALSKLNNEKKGKKKFKKKRKINKTGRFKSRKK